MDLVFTSWDSRLLAFSAGLLMLFAWKLGSMTGQLSRRRSNPEPTAFAGASIGLLALLLGFTFSAAVSKYEARRLAVVADTNAIDDFYTSATLLKEPYRTRLRDLIRRYTEARLQAAQAISSRSDLQAHLPIFGQMQDQMTQLVSAALNDGTPIAVPLTNTLNALVSAHGNRLAAIEDHLPGSIVFLLVATATFSAMLVGREQGFAGNGEVWGAFLYIFLVALVLSVILDLDQPGQGILRASQQPLERLLQSMTGP